MGIGFAEGQPLLKDRSLLNVPRFTRLHCVGGRYGEFSPLPSKRPLVAERV